ncbi:acyl-CoA dehydrogenase family protein [Methylobacillus flagellatus]|uniref:Putative acyl-CoA dehydrogenase n=1 Tax=Methylobacillus flagellatus (strain ATCC 51484 / DSM 6875 / VKM B-1610 / KT) TaxID=265072 RepID=Q1GZ96_METFK|nr:acyl-CoA dehydrogenase family protein [Methylobacillus flagellatus]ABE50441.1 putative acyl-CoA dehydrogenase [Methylobacillus flagellatus KT]
MSALVEPTMEFDATMTAHHDDMLHAVMQIARTSLADMVEDIDRRGTYPETVLKQLGEAGAYDCRDQEAGSVNLQATMKAIAAVSEVCAATGFMMWCHAACGLYMDHSNNPALKGVALQNHLQGKTLGGTALSNPMKAMAGIEKMLLKAQKVDGGYLINGTLPWVSNLGKEHYFGAIAIVQSEQGERELMFMGHCNGQGIELKDCPSFAGMEGTGTWALRFKDAFINDSEVIAENVPAFLNKIRASFILLQCGMGWGVTQSSINEIWNVEQQLGHVNEFLEDRPLALQAELDALKSRTLELAATPYETDKQYLIDVLDVRAHASELALRAAQSAVLHTGARGYLMSSPVQRKVRESHFVAIVTPALKHLRREMARLSKMEQPS